MDEPVARRPTFSASAQSLGYLYQNRFALLKLLSLPETSSILIEAQDDIEFVSASGVTVLGSLKHKSPSDALTDLSTDFWKSVRVWLSHYVDTGHLQCKAEFLLFTTSIVSSASFLVAFKEPDRDSAVLAKEAQTAAASSSAKIVVQVAGELAKLTDEERLDFWKRVTIVDSSMRITAIPTEIMDRNLRTVFREFRSAVFERLEGWWNDQVIKLLSGERTAAISGFEVSDKLAMLSEEFRTDNLPIDFRNRNPGQIQADTDPRMFVEQLRALALSAKRIQFAIVDYYRAFEQRSSWARENLLISGEMAEYENRLVEEWERYRAVVCEDVTDESEDAVCQAAGKALYNWAMDQTNIRIRERVTEPYVVRGTFQMLANGGTLPRVHWHPRFLKRLGDLLGVPA